MKKLVLLLGAFALTGCREKKATGDKGADAGKADVEAVDPAPSGNTEGLESQLIGCWAIDPSKIVKALEANPPEGVSEEQLAGIKTHLTEDWEEHEADDSGLLVIQFSKGGRFSLYSGEGRHGGTYAINLEADRGGDLGIRMKITELSEFDLLIKNLNQQAGSSKEEVEEYDQKTLKELNTRYPTLMVLSKERLTVVPPEGAEEEMPFSLFLSRLGDSEGKERVKRTKERARINLEKEREFLKSQGEGEGE